MTTKLLTLLAAAGLLAAPAFAEAETATPTAATQTAASETEPEPAASEGGVVRATFTTAVADREPVDSVDALTSDHVKVYYFTEIEGLAGETLTHRWEWNGQVMAQVSFEVGSERWRTYSSKNLDPTWLGEWTVTVIDSKDRILRTDKFAYNDLASVPGGATTDTAAAEQAAPQQAAPPAAIE